MKNIKTLLLLTDYFPFDTYEVFLEQEISYLSKSFDTIYILACYSKENKLAYPLLGNVKAYPFSNSLSFTDKLTSLQFLFSKPFAEEIKMIRSVYHQSLSVQKVKTMLAYLQSANSLKHRLRKFIAQEKLAATDLIIYSMWADWRALAATMVSKKTIAVTKAHNTDVYFERHPENYLPFRKLIYEKIDTAFFIAENGRDYTQAKIPSIQKNKLKLLRLGVSSKGKNPDGESKELVVVSCSRMDVVKRIDLIGEILAASKLPIRWIHFGDGKQFDDLNKKSINWKNKSSALQVEWKGNVANEEVMQFYITQHVDLFINMSEYEGIPVAMMEAMSAGIPVMATDAGGVNELVNDENGKLISQPVAIENAVEWLQWFYKNSAAEKRMRREKAFETWKLKYNAEINCVAFANELLSVEK